MAPLLLLSVAAAHAGQTAALAPITVTGGRVATQSFDQPYAIDVVDTARLRDGQLRVNASEALAAVPGVVVLNRQNYAQDLQISSRGFGARSAFGVRGVVLLVDGIPATNPDGQGQLSTFNLDAADRIEVLRGPFSSLYGNHAGGVIQLFTRDGEGPPQVSLGVTGGTSGTRKLDLGSEGARGSMGYVIDASRFQTDGYRQHSAAQRDQGFAKLTLRPDPATRLQLIAQSLRQDDTEDPLGLTWTRYLQNPRSVEAAAETFNTRKSIDHLQGGVTYTHQFDTQEIEFRAYSGTRSVLQFQSTPVSVQGNPRNGGGVVDLDRRFDGAGARWSVKHAVAAGTLTLTAGADFSRALDDRRGYENFSGTTLGVIGALRRDEDDGVRSLDQYLQLSWKKQAWIWNAGLHHSAIRFHVTDHYIVPGNGDDSGSVDYQKVTPSLGVLYQLTPFTNLYASAATGMETPTLNELAYSGNGGGFNFDLRPARSKQVEVGLKALLGETARVDAALYQINTRDELVVQGSVDGRTSYQNAASTLRQGLEIGFDADVAHSWHTRLALTQLRALYDRAFVSKGTVIDAGRRLPAIPATTLYGELAWKPRGDFSIALEGVYRSHMFVEDSNAVRPAPGYALANLRLTDVQRYGRWRLSEMFRIDNLFDRRYISSVIVADANGRYYEPGAGRSWFAGLRAAYEF